MRKKVWETAFIVILLMTATGAWAQPNGGGGGQGQGGNPPSTSGPIDGGATVLLIGIAGYAYYQSKQRKENNI